MHDGKVIFTPSKVDYHHEKIEAYMAGQRIFPTTIELDLSQRCSRNCSGCPYSVSRAANLSLDLPFLDRLFSILGPHTSGIVFSGGEPTIYPFFGEAMRLARQKGFTEICVISNGENIDDPVVQDALLENVTAVRISQYEWQTRESQHFLKTLKKIEGLRERIDKEGSALEIGASMLTRAELNDRYLPVGRAVLSAGVHWLYFHPYCVDWQNEHPKQADQAGVLSALEAFKDAVSEEDDIQVPYARYGTKPLHFEKLHGSHFLLQVGADGVVYAGPECKYEEEFALLDLNQDMPEDFLWDERRVGKIDQINSDNYRFIGTKHRPPMFSDYIQRLIDSRRGEATAGHAADAPVEFAYPNIV